MHAPALPHSGVHPRLREDLASLELSVTLAQRFDS
jgi:hypothetical protein